MPLSLTPLAWTAIVGMLLAGTYWAVDAIGNYREAEVWAQINASIAKTNADIGAANTLDDKLAAVQEDARRKALANAAALASKCPASESVAKTLSQVH